MLIKHFVQITVCSTVLRLLELNTCNNAPIDFNVNTNSNPMETSGRQDSRIDPDAQASSQNTQDVCSGQATFGANGSKTDD